MDYKKKQITKEIQKNRMVPPAHQRNQSCQRQAKE
jgi:hypothetical protein